MYYDIIPALLLALVTKQYAYYTHFLLYFNYNTKYYFHYCNALIWSLHWEKRAIICISTENTQFKVRNKLHKIMSHSYQVQQCGGHQWTHVVLSAYTSWLCIVIWAGSAIKCICVIIYSIIVTLVYSMKYIAIFSVLVTPLQCCDPHTKMWCAQRCNPFTPIEDDCKTHCSQWQQIVCLHIRNPFFQSSCTKHVACAAHAFVHAQIFVGVSAVYSKLHWIVLHWNYAPSCCKFL